MTFKSQSNEHASFLSLGITKLLLLLVISVLFAYAASKGEATTLAIIFSALVGIAIASNYKLLLYVTLFGGLVISGLTQLYFPQLQLVRWAFAASSTILLLHVAMSAIKSDVLRVSIDSAVLFCSLIFVVVLLISTVLQNVELNVAAISLKGYLQMWGLYLALALFPWKPSEIDKLPIFILFVALVQIPFVLHQFIFLVPMRELITDVKGLVPIDVVSGTFGGKIDHGSANAALSILCFITGAGLLALWKNKQLATRYFSILILLVMFPAFINSSKISIIYLFILFVLIYSDEIITHPLKTIARSTVILMLCLLIAFSVISTLPESRKIDSLGSLFEQTYNYNFGNDTIRNDNLSRGGAINVWINSTAEHGYKNIIIGYGIGSSRIITSEAGRKISKTINLERAAAVTALAAILWETGIVGLLSVILLFISAFYTTVKLKRIYSNNAYRLSLFTALQYSVVILFISLAHKSFFIYHIGYQTLFALLFGYLVYWERRANQYEISKN